MTEEPAIATDQAGVASKFSPWRLRFAEAADERAFHRERIAAYRGTFASFMAVIAVMAAALFPLDFQALNGEWLYLTLAVRCLFIAVVLGAAGLGWRYPHRLAAIAAATGGLVTIGTTTLTLLHGASAGGPMGNTIQFAFIGLIFIVLLPSVWESRLLLAGLLVAATFAVAEVYQGLVPDARILQSELFVTGAVLMLLFLGQREERLRREEYATLVQLRTLAVSDPLTGAANRRAFFEQATKEQERAVREGTSLAVLALDIDHFKAINDGYGHAAGDRVLQTLVAAVGATLRPFDTLARTGGEEFAVLLSGTDLAQAECIGERIREQIADLQVPWTAGALTFTVSIGVAAWCPGETIDATLGRADDGLYRAKQEGRDQVRQPAEMPATP